jgi:hypothetical protein
MWQAAGSRSSKEPWEWSRRDDATSFIADLASTLNLRVAQVWKTGRGKNGGTWAHWQIASDVRCERHGLLAMDPRASIDPPLAYAPCMHFLSQ